MRRQLDSTVHVAGNILVAASLVLPATGLGSLVHFTLVEHTVCVEHGSVAHHGDHAHEPGVEVPLSSVHEADSPRSHGHDHCFVASCTRLGSVVPPVGLGDVGVAANVGVVLEPADATAPVAILRLAPKSSPPV